MHKNIGPAVVSQEEAEPLSSAYHLSLPVIRSAALVVTGAPRRPPATVGDRARPVRF
jgi:hypothetical protein